MIIYIKQILIGIQALQAQREGKTVRNVEALNNVPVNNIPIEHFSVNNLERIGKEIQDEKKKMLNKQIKKH